MNPVAVLESLDAMGYAPAALDTVGRNIIALEVVSVHDLVAVGLSGQDIIAVRRALDPSVGASGASFAMTIASASLSRGDMLVFNLTAVKSESVL